MLYRDSYQRHDTKREKDGQRRREEVGGIEGKKKKRKNRKRERGQEVTRSQARVLHFERQQLSLVGA